MDSAADTGWTVACLGPLRLVHRGLAAGAEREVRLSAAQRNLLAVLLLAGGRVLSADTILDILWPHQRPATARASLQNTVSRIRGLSNRGVIITHGDGYRLGVPSDIDSVRSGFADAAEHLRVGDAASALATTDAHLAQWRGQPFEGMDELDGVSAAESIESATAIARIIDLERSALDGIDGLVWFDPNPVLCPDDPCRSYQDGRWMWRDGGHISREGARRLEPLIAEAIAEVARA